MSCSHSQHGTCMQDALAFAEQYCVEKGLRFTDLRRKVFQLIWNSHKALTASDVMNVLGKDQPPLTYRALEFLKDQKLVHYIASLNAYVGCTNPNRAHISQLFICEDCHDVTELPGDATAHTLKISAQQADFKMHQTFIEVLGQCKDCRTTL
jgi:Fur family zinc uptake transcriptional regulator